MEEDGNTHPKPPESAKLTEKDISGLKYFDQIAPLLRRLHDDACDRDTAGKRTLHYNQCCMLMLLYFFNPIVTLLRGLQQTSELKNVQTKRTFEMICVYFCGLAIKEELMAHIEKLKKTNARIRGVFSTSRSPPFTLRASFAARHPHALDLHAAFHDSNPSSPRHAPIRYLPRTAIIAPNSIGREPIYHPNSREFGYFPGSSRPRNHFALQFV